MCIRDRASRLAVNDGDGSYILCTDDNSATVLDAVSYTHLDVYKRQVLHISRGFFYEFSAPFSFFFYNFLLFTVSQVLKLYI